MTRRRHTVVVLVLMLVLGLAVAALAVPPDAGADDDCTVSWTGGVGAWSDATRWSPQRVPADDDRVCVVRAPGATPVSVRVTGSTGVEQLTVRDAAVTYAAGTLSSFGTLHADGAAIGGPGEVLGSGATLRDTRLAATDIRLYGVLNLAGRITFTGGARLALGTPADPRVNVVAAAGTRVVDGDGNPGNRLSLAGGLMYADSLFVGVALVLGDVGLFAQRGQVILSALANLAPDGTLQARFGFGRLQLGAFGDGELVLPVAISRIGPKVDVQAGRITTRDGGDALAGLSRVEGSLRLDRAVSVGAVDVPGTLSSTTTLTAATVTVAGSLDAAGVTGALTCTGRCYLPGARVGSLTLGTAATVTTDATRPLTVAGRATLAGTLVVQVPSRGRPGPGATVVVLSAAGGVRGTFATVRTDLPNRTVTAGYASTYVTGTIGAAA